MGNQLIYCIGRDPMSHLKMATKSLFSPLYTPSPDDEEEIETIPEAVRKQTQIILYEYVGHRSQTDRELNGQQASFLHDCASTCIRETGEVEQGEAAEMIADLLREYGDKFQSELEQDDRLQEAMELAVTDTDSGQPNPLTMAAHVRAVVVRVFGTDINGIAQNITIGRIASVLYYIYSLCKRFIQNTFANHTVVQFLCALGGYLILSFVKVRFFQWLNNQGGWGQAITSMFPSLIPPWTNNMLLVGGVLLIGLWAYRIFRGLN